VGSEDRLRLTFASLDYLDRTRALLDGSVRPDGIELTCLRFGPYELFQRVAQGVEFDVAEMSASTYMSMVSQGDTRYVAIPVFLSRQFRHGYIFVHGASDIRAPADLAGRRVGVPDYEMTAALWQRAILMHDFGVQPEQISWFQGGEFQPGFVKRVDLPVTGVSIDVIPDDRTLHDMVATGEIDAVLCPHRPAALTDGSGRVRRLFPDFVEVERDYYRRTGLFPIMHLTVVRRDLYDQHPWVAASLVRAFVEAQALGWKRMGELGSLAVMLPWLTRDLEEIADELGPSFWAYGFRENQAVLEAMCRYSFEQGLSARELAPDELFAAETYDLSL
jgi:4,5-dihydroxyphthalate decarboxylase